MSCLQLDHLFERVANDVPHSFKCAADGKWHEADKYSKNQIAKWKKKKKFVNDGITPENIGLICKNHSQQRNAEHEIKCHGPCGAWKYKEYFSKTQRSESEPWCTACSTWATSNGGDETPNPAPGEVLQEYEMIAQTVTVQDHIPNIADDNSDDGTAEEHSHSGGSTLNHQSTFSDAIDDDLGDIDGSVVGAAVTMMRSMSLYEDDDGITGSSTMEREETDIADGISIATFTSHSKLEDESELLRSFRNAPPQPGFLGTGELSRLYCLSAFHRAQNSDSFSDSFSNSTEDITSEMSTDVAQDIATPKAARLAPVPPKKWFRPDNRRVFYAPRTYAARPADNTNTRGPIEDSDSDDDDF
ncbi:hypothetical protein F5Y06DRAFT_4726 [Hypoxylon sp. FL0890]|nr:hypothetical protein F5Y06DRAFT_4726 [Hypoxylon sp. FL0890]